MPDHARRETGPGGNLRASSSPKASQRVRVRPSRPRPQFKLVVGSADDQLEREADRTADDVVALLARHPDRTADVFARSPNSRIRRATTTAGSVAAVVSDGREVDVAPVARIQRAPGQGIIQREPSIEHGETQIDLGPLSYKELVLLSQQVQASDDVNKDQSMAAIEDRKMLLLSREIENYEQYATLAKSLLRTVEKGWWMTLSLPFLIKYIKVAPGIDKAEKARILADLESALGDAKELEDRPNEELDLKVEASRIVNRIAKLKVSESITMLGGYKRKKGSGHAMLYRVRRVDASHYHFSIFNTGEGLVDGKHPYFLALKDEITDLSMLDLKHLPVVWQTENIFVINVTQLNPKNVYKKMHALLELRISGSDSSQKIVNEIYAIVGSLGKQVSSSPDSLSKAKALELQEWTNRLQKAQSGSNCAWKVGMAYLKNNMQSGEYHNFKLWMLKAVADDYNAVLESLRDELSRLEKSGGSEDYKALQKEQEALNAKLLDVVKGIQEETGVSLEPSAIGLKNDVVALLQAKDKALKPEGVADKSMDELVDLRVSVDIMQSLPPEASLNKKISEGVKLISSLLDKIRKQQEKQPGLKTLVLPHAEQEQVHF